MPRRPPTPGRPPAGRTTKSPARPARPARPTGKAGAKPAARSTKPAARSTKPAPRSATKAANKSSSRALSKVDGSEREAKRASMRTRRRMAGALVSTVLLVGVLFAAGFPLRSYLTQRASTRKAVTELNKLEAERKAVDAERKKLGTPAEIEERAREAGYVKPGEEAYNILPSRTDPIGLPDGWPFTGVEQVLRGR